MQKSQVTDEYFHPKTQLNHKTQNNKHEHQGLKENDQCSEEFNSSNEASGFIFDHESEP
jgi:hypothetical protein